MLLGTSLNHVNPLTSQSKGSFQINGWQRLWQRTWGCFAGERARRTWAWMTQLPSRVPPMSNSGRISGWRDGDSLLLQNHMVLPEGKEEPF